VRTLVGATLVRLLADGEGHVAVFDHVLDLSAHYRRCRISISHSHIAARDVVSLRSALTGKTLRTPARRKLSLISDE